MRMSLFMVWKKMNTCMNMSMRNIMNMSTNTRSTIIITNIPMKTTCIQMNMSTTASMSTNTNITITTLT